jgi:hypothetical protein
MSLKIIKKNSRLYEHLIFIDQEEDEFDVSDIIIPFSEFFKNKATADIYCGSELIPFEKRDSEYKNLLKSEFL